jgi:hypothetical protein
MGDAQAEIVLSVTSVDGDEDVDRAYASLRRELVEAGIDTRSVAAADGPPGSKSGFQVAQLAVGFVSGTTPALVSLLLSWKNRQREGCQLHVELPNGQRLEMPVTLTEAREMLDKYVKPQ